MIKLRTYQQEALDSLIKAFKKKKTSLLVLPTGAGKTVIFSHLVKELGIKTLAVAHTVEIIQQIQKTAEKVGVSDLLSAASIQLCSLRRDKIAKEGFELLIVDECHRICSPSYEAMIKAIAPLKLLGVTATPFRTDKKKIKDLLGEPVYTMGLLEMIQNGFLADFEGYRCQTQIDVSGVATKNGDFQQGALSSIINVSNRNELIVDQYLELAADSKALAFCADVAHCVQLEKVFNSRGIPSRAIYGKLTRDQRAGILEDFRSGRIRVLTNCQILTEGFDEPSIETLLMARPTISKVLYTQMIGRGSRKAPGKNVCKVIEFTDNYFNVCFLSDLLEMRCLQLEFKAGERLSSLYDRNEELLAMGGECIVTREVIIPLSINERGATPWQIMQLEKLGVLAPGECTEAHANKLLYG